MSLAFTEVCALSQRSCERSHSRIQSALPLTHRFDMWSWLARTEPTMKNRYDVRRRRCLRISFVARAVSKRIHAVRHWLHLAHAWCDKTYSCNQTLATFASCMVHRFVSSCGRIVRSTRFHCDFRVYKDLCRRCYN